MFRHSTVNLACVVLASLVATASVLGCGGDDQNQGASGAVPSKVTAAEAQTYVDAINAVRASVTQPSNYSGAWVQLPDVVWSDEVAASAQGWADYLASKGCGLEHESQSRYGENLAAGTGLSAQRAVDMWASEESKYTWSPSYSMADFNQGSGHYTQLVWRASAQVGCGAAACGRIAVVSCRFSPPGNAIGTPVY